MQSKITVICLSVVIILILLSTIFQPLELMTLDTRFKLIKKRKISPQVVIININDQAVKELGGWRITRDNYAYLIHTLSEYGAKAIGFFIFFGEQDRAYPENDAIFAQFSERAGNVYQAFFFRELSSDSTSALREDTSDKLLDSLGWVHQKTDILQGIEYSLPLKVILQSAKGIGHVNITQDADGVIRRSPLFVAYQDRLFPSLGLALACDALSINKGEIKIKPGHSIELIDPQGNKICVPIDQKGRMLINYIGGIESFDSYSLLQVLQSYRQLRAGEKPVLPISAFKDKIVLVTATVSGVTDLRPTPYSNAYPAVGIQAQVIDNILCQNFLHRPGLMIRIVLLLILGLIVAFVIPRLKLYLRLLFMLLLAAFYLLAACFVFRYWNLWLDMVAPILTILICSLSVIFFELWIEGKRLKAIEDKKLELEKTKKKIEREKQGLQIKLERKSDELMQIQQELNGFKLIENSTGTARKNIEKKYGQLLSQYPGLKNVEKSIIGRSPQIRWILENIILCASTNEPVLICGETGTGKTLVAEAIHQLSRQGVESSRLMVFNCARFESGDPRILLGELFGYGPHHGIANLPREGQDGILKEADKGTVFMDEVGDLPPQGQNLLLAPLDGKEFYPAIGKRIPIKSDIRFIFATNKNLLDMVKNGRFREDLLSRIKIFQVKIPPLRERGEDIDLLVEHFLRKENAKYDSKIRGTSSKLMNTFHQHPWHDNIRGLENAIKFSAAKARLEGVDVLRVSHLPDELMNFSPQVSSVKKKNLEDTLLPALKKHRFNIMETAKKLGKDRDTITQWFKGMCFETLWKNEWKLNLAAQAITGDEIGLSSKVETKMKGYIEAMFALINEDPDHAMENCLKANRKIPQRYRGALEKLVQACLEKKVRI